MDGCKGFWVVGDRSWIRTRPGFAQSFGCSLSGSKAIASGGVDGEVLWQADCRASTRVRASGWRTARESGTRRPWECVREASK